MISFTDTARNKMLLRSEIKHLHLELSSHCNARCPLCTRNFFGFEYNRGYKEAHLTLEKIQNILPVDFVQQLDEILINGTHGDFVMNPESAEIVSWLRQTNSQMHIHISTNGSARNKKFWKFLGTLDVEISFCIDGLEDTHHIYRQDTSYNKIINNARYFIESGGRAVWTMTEFDHNKHQFKQAEQISKSLNFYSFNKRPTSRNVGPVFNKHGKKVFVMRQETPLLPDQINEEWINSNARNVRRFMPTPNKDPVKLHCEALRDKSLYLSSIGEFDPCCYLGLIKSGMPGNTDLHSLRAGAKTSIDDAIEWYNLVIQSFGSQQLGICQVSCAVKL